MPCGARCSTPPALKVSFSTSGVCYGRYVLHTFASHFMMNGGNIIALQQILGYASIQQTIAYAHLAPDYLQNAIVLIP